MGARDYSSTAGSNTSVGGVSIAEGMARASVNNAIRAELADISDLLKDLGGGTATTGSADAYLLSLPTAPAAYADNLLFAATANFSNSGGATMNVNSLGVKNIRKMVAGASTALASGDLPSGHIGLFVYSSANSAIILLNPYLTTTADFAGPGSSTDNAVVRFDGTTGKTGQNSGIVIDDSNNVTGVASLTIASGGHLELGNNSDTTFARVSAGVASIEGDVIDTLSLPSVLTNKTLTAPTVNGLTNGTGIASGTYTPTASTVTNASGASGLVSHYMRLGNQIHVEGAVNVDPASTGQVVITLTLPIVPSSNFAATSEASGIGSVTASGTSTPNTGTIYANTGAKTVKFDFVASDVAARDYAVSFTYTTN